MSVATVQLLKQLISQKNLYHVKQAYILICSIHLYDYICVQRQCHQ